MKPGFDKKDLVAYPDDESEIWHMAHDPCHCEQAISLSRLTGIRHGFFGREAGGKDRSAVLQQFRESPKLAQCLSLGAQDAIVIANQQHTTHVIEVTDSDWYGVADALVTRQTGVFLGVLTADCAPLLFADVAAGVVGACHAGWRGAIGGIVQRTVHAMEQLGARSIVAAIGPMISQQSYQVGEDLRTQVLRKDKDCSHLFLRCSTDHTRWRFDFPGYIIRCLTKTGVEVIERVQIDTMQDARFFSFRHASGSAKPCDGRQVSMIGLEMFKS